MTAFPRYFNLTAVIAVAALASGCGSMNKSDSSSPPSSASPAPAAAATPSGPKIGPGMNERGEVTDSRLVESGFGQKVKGLDDWEGEITGKCGPASKFNQVKIGMSHTQVIGLLGQPADQGAHPTGKAWIPFYFGSDKYRYEITYKGQGRLLFASSAGFSFGDMHLIWVICSPSEAGPR